MTTVVKKTTFVSNYVLFRENKDMIEYLYIMTLHLSASVIDFSQYSDCSRVESRYSGFSAACQ